MKGSTTTQALTEDRRTRRVRSALTSAPDLRRGEPPATRDGAEDDRRGELGLMKRDAISSNTCRDGHRRGPLYAASSTPDLGAGLKSLWPIRPAKHPLFSLQNVILTPPRPADVGELHLPLRNGFDNIRRPRRAASVWWWRARHDVRTAGSQTRRDRHVSGAVGDGSATAAPRHPLAKAGQGRRRRRDGLARHGGSR